MKFFVTLLLCLSPVTFNAQAPDSRSASLAAETAQHAGHADILRETLDGQKTM